jgi:hypothetical protein
VPLNEVPSLHVAVTVVWAKVGIAIPKQAISEIANRCLIALSPE